MINSHLTKITKLFDLENLELYSTLSIIEQLTEFAKRTELVLF